MVPALGELTAQEGVQAQTECHRMSTAEGIDMAQNTPLTLDSDKGLLINSFPG